MSQNQSQIFACIDCGSHSTRLLIAEVGAPHSTNISTSTSTFKTVHKDTRVTRLGQEVQKTKQLSKEGINATLDCIQDYMDVIKGFNPHKLRIVATAAARNAENRRDFFSQITEIGGVVPELLDGKREAELSFLGATSTVSGFPAPYLCLDIGGGSSEFAFGEMSCEATVSLDIGSVNLTEKYITHDPPQAEELYTCLSLVETHLSDVVQAIPEVAKTKTFIGVAGTITTAAAVELGYYDPEDVHHFRLSIEAAEDVFRTISIEDRAQRKSNPGLHPDRVDVIVAGLTILIKTMRFFGFSECLVSEADLLDGIIMDMTRT